jgi:glycosyltransferase involved in cell wall biosynthesis
MKLSVIIPCYNAADTISDQLDAMVNQEWSEPWEVVVVNNRSTDLSMSIVRSYQKLLPNLRIIDAFEQQGQPYALNTGIKAALGESVAFCDSDDVVGEGWIAAMGEALAMHEFVACRMDTEKLNSEWLQQSRGNSQLEDLPSIWYPPFMLHAGGGTLGIRRSLCLEVGEFDAGLPCLHDTDYCFRIQQRGVALHFVPEAVMHIRFRDSLLDIYRQARNYAKYNVKLSKRHRPIIAQTVKDLLRPWVRYFRKWVRQARLLPLARNRVTRGKWVWSLGWQVGRLQGSLRHRVPPV